MDKGSRLYLFDQHVQVFWDIRCQACHSKITLSVQDQAEAVIEKRAISMDEAVAVIHEDLSREYRTIGL